MVMVHNYIPTSEICMIFLRTIYYIRIKLSWMKFRSKRTWHNLFRGLVIIESKSEFDRRIWIIHIWILKFTVLVRKSDKWQGDLNTSVLELFLLNIAVVNNHHCHPSLLHLADLILFSSSPRWLSIARVEEEARKSFQNDAAHTKDTETNQRLSWF